MYRTYVKNSHLLENEQFLFIGTGQGISSRRWQRRDFCTATDDDMRISTSLGAINATDTKKKRRTVRSIGTSALRKFQVPKSMEKLKSKDIGCLDKLE